MFSIGTQRKFWNFQSLDELDTLREKANDRFVKKHIENVSECLKPSEELIIRRGYEEKLRDFCARFKPQLTNSVVGTALLLFKRLFLHHSVMELPIEDYMHACTFLACKVDEFNISARQYVANLEVENRDPDDVAHDILSIELDLMEKLRFHLVVHTPYRQVEGLIIDIKTRCADVDAEKLRPGISSFLHKSLLSDVLLIYPPSQVALSATIASATNLGMNVALDSFIANKLLANASYDVGRALISQLQKIKHIVRSVKNVDEAEFSCANSKLNSCYKTFDIIPKCWYWKLSEPLQYDLETMEGGNFDDDDDDD